LKPKYVLRNERDVEDMWSDMRKALGLVRVGFVEEITRYGLHSSRGLTTYRLPSKSGGSYRRSLSKRTVHDSINVMGSSQGEVYSNHPHALKVEYGTRPHRIKSHGDYPLVIRKRLPRRSPDTYVPYGVKYIDVYEADRREVTHPGARPFYIFTETFLRMAKRMRPLLRKLFKREFGGG